MPPPHRLARRLLFVAAALTIAACAKVGPVADAGARHPWTIPGVVRLGYSDEPDNLNPMFAHAAASDEVDSLLFAPMFRYDDAGRFVPELATEVPTTANGGISKDGKTIVLHFRRGVTWADGVPLTAHDLRFTFRAMMNDANDVKTRFGWDDIAAIDVPNDLTAVVRLKVPDADILGNFAIGGAAVPPLPEHLLGKLPDLNRAAFNAHPLSSGPFELASWQHGAKLTFVPNPRYWRGPPQLKRIVWAVIPNSESLFAALQTHAIDVYADVDVTNVAAAEKLPGIVVKRRLLANWRRLMINASRPGLRDIAVRRAIAESVDWRRINDVVYHGYNVLAVSDIVPTSWAAPKLAPYPYDPQGAERALDAAGWRPGPDGIRTKDGRRLSFVISSTNLQVNAQAEVQMQQALRPIGIALTIKNYPPSLLFAQDGPLYTGAYDLEWSIDTNGPDPDNEGSWSGNFIPPNGANTTFYNDPELTKLSRDALLVYSHAARKAIYQREERRLHDLVLYVPLYWEVGFSAYNSDLKNYRPAQYIADNWNAWEWRI